MDVVTIDLQALQTGLYCAAIALSTVGVVKFIGQRNTKPPEEREPIVPKTDPVADWKELVASTVNENAADQQLLMDSMARAFRKEVKRVARQRMLPEHEYVNLHAQMDRCECKARKGEMTWGHANYVVCSWINRRIAYYQRNPLDLPAPDHGD
jgi:hypothetical protein